MNPYLKIHQYDHVAVALEDLAAGSTFLIDGAEITLTSSIPGGHKFALTNLAPEDAVIKYGSPIGIASQPISAGDHVHTHNLRTALTENVEYTYRPNFRFTPDGEKAKRQFMGYPRANGKAGIRNEIWIIPTVGCVNNVAQKIAEMAKQRLAAYDGIDDYIPFTHPYGCSQLGDDQENTRRILADLCMHPNAGGVLLLGLGCENSGVEEVKKYISDFDRLPIKTLVAQDVEDEISCGLDLVSQLAEEASKAARAPTPLSQLVVGVKCGGSDGLSGITANPLVGQLADTLIHNGGSIIMTEVPEMFGAETMLMNRCINREIFEKTAAMIDKFKHYFTTYGHPIYENPSPGNKAGGITTLEDKSLGCTQKSGSSPVVDVLDYGETAKTAGLSLLYAPGNDLVASTALAASGAQLILFTTGRGTPFSAPVPTIKISSNTALSNKKSNWIDFDAGVMTESAHTAVIARQLYDYVLRVAEGKKVKAELSGYHDMAIFKQNITL